MKICTRTNCTVLGMYVLRVLLSLKASQVQVDAVDEDGWTPLHAAVYWGNFEAAELLVTHGAQIDKKTNAVRGHYG